MSETPRGFNHCNRCGTAKAKQKCPACSSGAMAGPVPGTLANGERCDVCELYESDDAARAVIAKATK